MISPYIENLVRETLDLDRRVITPESSLFALGASEEDVLSLLGEVIGSNLNLYTSGGAINDEGVRNLNNIANEKLKEGLNHEYIRFLTMGDSSNTTQFASQLTIGDLMTIGDYSAR